MSPNSRRIGRAAKAERTLAAGAPITLLLLVIASANALTPLEQAGELACQPSLPHFCANLHVACAGQLALATHAFRVRLGPDGVSVDAPPEAQAILGAYRSPRVEWAEDAQSLVLLPRQGAGYIRLQPEGKFSLRHYIGDQGVMAIGSCSRSTESQAWNRR